MQSIWTVTNQGKTFTTTVTTIEAAGGRRKATMPNSFLRIGDLRWETDTPNAAPDRWTREFAGNLYIIFNQ